jgi:uncharacterized surface protein with fasciclin (FAS1) repeats
MSHRPTVLVRTGVLATALFIPLTLTACSSGSKADTAAAGTSATMSAAASDTSSAAASTSVAGMMPFGSACSAVPATGAGSFDGMSTAPVATAASANPVLKTLVAAVTAAGLGDTLNSAPALTVFAPADSAFAKVPPATLKELLADPKGDLTKILTYHVIAGKLTPEQLAGTHKTLNGAQVSVAGSGDSFTVGAGKAKVVCGNVQTANATVYIIDSVLMPPAK